MQSNINPLRKSLGSALESEELKPCMHSNSLIHHSQLSQHSGVDLNERSVGESEVTRPENVWNTLSSGRVHIHM